MRGREVAELLRRYGYAVAVAAVALATLAFLPLRSTFDFAHLSWLYLCVVGLVAWLAGTGPALTAALLSFVAGNFFFTVPYGTFHVTDARDVIQLVVSLFGGIVVGALTGRSLERRRVAEDQEQRATALARLAAEMATGSDVDTVVESAAGSLVRLAGVESVIVWLAVEGNRLEARGPGARFVAEHDHELAMHAFEQVKAIGLPETPHGADHLGSGWPAHDVRVHDECCGVLLPLISAANVEGVLQLLPQSEGLTPEEYPVVVSVSHLLAVFLAGQRAMSAAARMEASKEAEQVKTAIVSGVSHELKTPLASAMAAVTDLAAEGFERDPAVVRERLVQVGEDLTRLSAAISDLLDLSRLQAEEWLPHPEPYEVGEILADVVTGSPADVRNRFTFAISESPSPCVYVDFAQLARAVRAIVENAVTYSPAGSEIVLGAARTADRTRIWVEDRGPGVSDADKPFVFDRAYRGDAGRRSPGSTGLGLTIARDLIIANRGTLTVEQGEPHGARFVVDLPCEPPAEL